MNPPPASVAGLSRSDKQALLRKVLLEKLSRPRTAPASFAQERLWFIDRLDPGNAAYNMPFALRLRGRLHPDMLERSLGEVVRRHEVLRTVFAATDGELVQVIRAATPVTLPFTDLGELPEEAREAEVRRLAWAEASRPFDLAMGPLLRVLAVRLDEAQWVLLVTMHHIVSDSWSIAVLIREISELYSALVDGRGPVLPALPVQYADYASWQRNLLQGEVLEAKLGYWRVKLADAPPLLELPTDRQRPQVQDSRGGSVRVELPAEVSRELRALSRRAGATAFMTLLAAWQLLLSRYAGQLDVSVGTPIAGRTRLETELLLGFFINTLVLRTDLSGEPTFRDLLERVRETTLGAYQHQEIPFERLVEELAPERSLSHAPLFQVMFVLENNEQGGLRMGELEMEPLAGGGGEIAKFDLTLGLAEDEHGFAGSLSYRAELWDEATVQRMVGHFARLVKAVLTEPDRPVSGVAFLGEEERAQVLVEWNGSAASPAEECVHELFAVQAARTPDAPAVSFAGETLTYAGLDQRSNRLAHALRTLGVGPEVRTALCLERSPDMVVAMLAILKAGGAYLPLDPASPSERLAYMVEDSGARVLLTRERHLELIPAGGARVLCTDRDAAFLQQQPDTTPGVRVSPSGLAYVIYTSGSTGRPKGVLVEHRSLAAFLHAMRREPGISADDTLLAVTTLSFDIAGLELFLPLVTGARTVLADRETASDPLRLAWALDAAGATVLQATPATWRMLLAAGWEGQPGLRALCGGEALAPDLAEQLLTRVDALWNLYGPTETTVWSTLHRVRPGGGAPPVGRPIAGTRVYVLDAGAEPVPPGVQGELLIGGAGVARGYHGRPELTAERFLPDPFSAQPGARMYRTGDRVRWLARGELEYLGRVDFQVKLRGFRIELGEIEAALLDEPSIREAVVVAREDSLGERRLVAYVVSAGGDAAGLREHLRRRLPEYMVPAAVVMLDSLPLTPSGKVDRRALPAPDASASGDAYVAPRTPAEEVLAGIYADVLHAELVGSADNFFELGGHSLLATRVVSRVRQAFGVELPLRALFEAPTVAGLAGRIDALRGGDAGPQAPPLAALPRDGSPLPLSFAQQRLWFIDQLQQGSAAYNMSFALRLRGGFDPAVLERSLTEIVRRHETLRTVFAAGGGEPVQVVRDAAPVALPVTDLRRLPDALRETEVLRLAAAEAERPFDLAAGPLLRVSALRLKEAEWAVLFTLHHIVSDGWSMGLLVHEVSELYDALAEGRRAELPELPVQYADYAAWQRAWLTGEALESRLAFWREKLADAPPLLELPTDRPRPQVQDTRGGSVAVRLPADVSRELRALSRREGATAFMTLLAAWQLLLARYAGVEDVSVGTPIAGRTRLETEGLIGFFVNTLVLRTDLSGEPTFGELLGRVREATLGAYQHQDIPFERLVEELAPERSLAHTPLFQALFVLQNNERGELRMGGLEVEPLAAAGEGIARFDLTLALAEDEEGVQGSLGYRAELWERAIMERMAAHFARLVEAVVADPARPVSEVPFLGEEERAHLLAEWSATAAVSPRATLHELLAARAARSPAAPAVSSGSRTLTYAELERGSNQLARRLRALGVGPETRVALCTERCAELVVAILGILRAGGVYVPVDPTYPPERIAYLLEDSGCAVVLVQEELRAKVPLTGAAVLSLEEALASVSGEEEEGWETGVSPENAAYVIYTSGSTGRPKGVVVTHANAVRLFQATEPWFGFGSQDVWTLFHSYAFDFSVWEIWGALLYGGRLVVVPWETSRSPEAFYDLLVREGVTVLNQTPSAFRQLDLAEQTGGVSPDLALRMVIFGGEALEPRSLRGWMERHGAETPRLVNMYGITETTVHVTYRPMGWAEVEAGAWRAATWAGRSSARSASFRMPSRKSGGRGCTARGTGCGGAPGERWSTWGASTCRSRCAASALSWGRSRRRCRAWRGCGKR
jgi:amino acid adenylation domain-containing protein